MYAAAASCQACADVARGAMTRGHSPTDAGQKRSGLLLIGATCLALALANSPLAPRYVGLLARPIGPLSVSHWIGDGLMALFFLGIGAEVKRALVTGELSHKGARVLPIAAAVSGMAVPALLYLAITGSLGAGAARGWAIPAATDIAFARAMLAFAGRGLPGSLGTFLTTVAVADDIGAVLIIATFYTAALDWTMLALALLPAAGLWLANRRRVGALGVYLLLGGLLWLAILRSGVHPTIAGVITGIAIPLHRDRPCPLDRLEQLLDPWVTLLILPLFALANAGLPLAGVGIAGLGAPIALAIAAALAIGKQAGVGIGAWLVLRLKLAPLPRGATPGQLYGVALLAGIGFTMSLFIAGLAFDDTPSFDAAKLGILVGSLLSAVAGLLVLKLAHLSAAVEQA